MSKRDRLIPRTSENLRHTVFNVTRFRQLRLARGFTQDDLAKKMGVSKSAISRWESGLDEPNARRFPQLAKFLQIDPMELTVVVDDPHGAKVA